MGCFGPFVKNQLTINAIIVSLFLDSVLPTEIFFHLYVNTTQS
jgi:hypothetical protein